MNVVPQVPAACVRFCPEAAHAILEWIETHGGKVRFSGPTANIAYLADQLAWPTRFLPKCGRLVPFLRAHGVQGATPDAIVGIRV